jgi:tetratricopeptide (TPR) repeat protein
MDQAIKLSPSDAGYLGRRCQIRGVANKDLDLALADCNAALKLKPQDADALADRALVYLRTNRLDDAIDDYTAIKRTNAALSLYGRGIAELRKGDTRRGNSDIADARAANTEIGNYFAKIGITP